MQLTGSQILLECLLEQGVDTIFGYPGGAVLNIYDELYRYQDKIKHIEPSHEQHAAHAADGYARSTGKVGVCLATSGPGATNLVTGIATAYMDSVPIVCITGNVTQNLLGLDSFQEVDITGVVMPVTKHAFLVTDVKELADTIRLAFKIAKEGRPGPVLIDIPKDITAAKTEYEKVSDLSSPLKTIYEPKVNRCKKLNLAKIEEAANLINHSSAPFIYVGGGVIASSAEEILAKFADKIDSPVSCSLMAQGSFDKTKDRYLGMLGMHGTMASATALKHTDLILAIGTRFSDRVLCNASTFAPDINIIHIDIDNSEFNKNIECKIKINADAKEALEALFDKVKTANHNEYMTLCKKAKEDYPIAQKAVEGANSGVVPSNFFAALHKICPDCIISTDVGQHQMWAAQYFDFAKSRHFLTSGGLGTMGFGLGAAIGAKVGNTDKTVVCVSGDGSFYMNLTELSTMAKYNLPVIDVVLDNGVLGMVHQWQSLFYEGRYSESVVNKNTDFSLLAKAFSIDFYEIENESDLESILKKAVEAKKPALIHVKVNKEHIVLPMVPAGKSATEPILSLD